MQVSQALNPRRIARSLTTILVLTLISTIAPPALFPELLSQSQAAPDGLNAYYRSDATGGNDPDLASPFVTNTCLTTKLQTITADWGTGGPTGGTSDCGTDNFTAYYTGYILGPKTGTVNFSGYADDVLFVRINGVSVVEKYLNSGTVSGSFNFTEGVAYPIQIWFHEVGGGAAFALNWDSSGSAAVVGSSYLASTAANLLTSQYQTGTCRIGYSAECPAYSPQEIYNLYGTTTDGNYWIMTGGSPSYQYVLMDRSIDSGGWILGMKANNTSKNFDWDDTYRWTTQSIDSATTLEDPSTYTPGRISSTGTGTDAKYEAFNTVYAQKIRAVFPEYPASTHGGRYTTNNNYGFMWEENLSSLTAGPALSSTYPVATYPLAASANCTGITTKILQDLFANSKRCLFRTPAASRTSGNDNTTSYDPIGASLFASQDDFAWWGINYTQPVSGGSPAAYHHSRFGFGWNENSPNTDEGSNDVAAGIGLFKASTGSNNWPTGSYAGCCEVQTGKNKQMAFEIYLRQSDPSLGAPTNLTATPTSSTAVRLSWTAPASTSPVEYVVQYKMNSAAWDSNVSTVRILDPGSNPTAAISGLTAGTIYNFRIFARTIDMSTKLYDTNSSATPAYVRSGHEDQAVDSAFNFGQNQFFGSSTESAFDLGSGTTFTLEAWVRPLTTSGSRIIAGKNGQYSLYMSNGSFGFNFYTTDVTAGIGGDSVYFGTSSVKADEWQHVAFTRSGTAFKFYYNGNLVSSSTLSPANSIKDGPAAFTIGGYATNDQAFSGQIDQVRLWSSERSLSEINDGLHRFMPTNTSGLVAAYGFNEGSGSNLNNLVYTGASTTDLTLTGGTQNWVSVATTTTVAPYTYVTFPRSILNANGGWKSPDYVSAVSAVVVGGGGGGNAQTDNTGWLAGGGGAGAYQYFTSAITGGNVETVTVGLGGRRGVNKWYQIANVETPTNGQDSKFLTRTSIGGGAGGGASNATGAAGKAGGSGGGGGGTYGGTGGSSVSGQGNNGGSGAGDCCASGGGGGAGGVGGNAVSAGNSSGTGGAAGNGVLNPLYISGTSPQYIAAGGAGGGLTAAGAAGTQGGTAFGANAVANSGSGGGGGGGGASSVIAGYGGSGVIILRYITALKPTYTKPTNAYLNVGMTETFTTNVAQDSATAVLTRTFRWESTTTGSNGTFTLIKQGTGAANAAFSWVPPDTRTSGSNYLYRLIVTDSDTAGLFITDSSTAFAVINPALSVSGTSTIAKRINLGKSETFTITLGTSTYNSSLSPIIPGISLDTSTAGLAVIKIAETMTVGTYYETLTVIDSVSASVVTPLIIYIAAPPTLLNTGEIVANDLILNLDAGNSESLISGDTTTVTSAIWKDLSGNGKNAQTTGTNSFNGFSCAAPTYYRDFGGYLDFNGTDQCFWVPYLGTNVRNSMSVEAWFKVPGTSIGAGVALMGQAYPTSSRNIDFSLGSAGSSTTDFRFGVFRGSNSVWVGTDGYTPDASSANSWTHMVGTYDGNNFKLYVNGVLVDDYANTASTSAADVYQNKSGYFIGRRFDGSNYFNGSIASIRVYDIPISLSQVQQNYNATKNRFTSANSSIIKPVQTYGDTTSETYTVTSGYGSDSVTLAAITRSGFSWSTSSSSAILSLQNSLNSGTYNDTVTVTDELGQSTYLPIRILVNKADSLTVTMDTATAVTYNTRAITIYPLPTVRGLRGTDSATSVTRFSSVLYTETSTSPINADTYTVRGTIPTFISGTLDNYLGVVYETSTATINKARQRALNIFLYGGTVGSPYLIFIRGGDGTGAVTATLTGVSSLTGCAISNHYLTASEQKQGFCEVRVVKAGDQNYLAETETAQLYFMAFINNQPTGLVGSGSTIALNGATSLETSTVSPPSITLLSTTSISLTGGGTLTITGTGFSGTFIVKFWRNKELSKTSANTTSFTVSATELQSIGATSGRISVITAAGQAVSVDTLTITP